MSAYAQPIRRNVQEGCPKPKPTPSGAAIFVEIFSVLPRISENYFLANFLTLVEYLLIFEHKYFSISQPRFEFIKKSRISDVLVSNLS